MIVTSYYDITDSDYIREVNAYNDFRKALKDCAGEFFSRIGLQPLDVECESGDIRYYPSKEDYLSYDFEMDRWFERPCIGDSYRVLKDPEIKRELLNSLSNTGIDIVEKPDGLRRVYIDKLFLVDGKHILSVKSNSANPLKYLKGFRVLSDDEFNSYYNDYMVRKLKVSYKKDLRR